MVLIGVLVMIVGALICACGWKMPVTAGDVDGGSGTTLNIGLLQDQHLVWELGLATIIVGAIFVAAGYVAFALVRAHLAARDVD